jgi:hypothetical protein
MLLLNSLFVHTLVSQTLLQQIENTYNALNIVSYIEDLTLSFKKEIAEGRKEMDNTTLELYGFDYLSMSSIQRQNILDSIDNIHRNSIHFKEIKTLSIEEQVNEFSDKIRAKPPVYVLNLIQKDEQTLQVDTGKLSFNLFYFDKYFKPECYVFVEHGRYVHNDTCYCSSIPSAYANLISKNALKVFRKTLQKQPKYLLYCPELEGMNTILYVLNDKIYVYRIAQMKEYELSDYIKQIRINK